MIEILFIREVSFLNSIFELYYFFVIGVVNPNGEKALKGLGKGFGG